MRVLWFTNTPCNYQSSFGGYNGGGWMSALQNEIIKQEDISLGICFCQDGQPLKVEQDKTIYYPTQSHKKKLKNKILDIVKYKDLSRDKVLWNHYINHFKNVINDFKPDIVEIFGSELYMGLAAIAAENIPHVLHIQGLLSLYIYIYLPPGVSLSSYYFQDWNPKNIYNRFQLYTYWKRSCYREQEILKYCKHVIGRTDWDENASKILNPNRIYHYGGEILRPEFYEEVERKIPEKLTIVTTSSNPMYKGFDYVLQTAYILKNKIGADFDWLVYGNVNPSFAEKLTKIKHEEVNVKLVGVADAVTLRDAISSATLYFQPSYIENSPNSVCEAQILGVPVVATNVGGTSSLIEHGRTGFLIPTNDPYTAVGRIMEVYNERNLNKEIGINARTVASKRHDRIYIVNNLISTYKEIIEDS